MTALGPRSDRPTWLPNALVWVRLVLAGVFVALLSTLNLTPHVSPDSIPNPVPDLVPDRAPASDLTQSGESRTILVLAAAIFIVAAITDMLDGMLARAWRCVSRFGRVMDPFADKVLVMAAFICMAGPNFAANQGESTFQASGISPWMVALILGRELLITSLRSLIEGEGGDFSAIWAGKWKMIAQSIAIPVILLALAFLPWMPGESGRWVVDLVAWTTLAITLLSAIPYITRASGSRPDASPPKTESAPDPNPETSPA